MQSLISARAGHPQMVGPAPAKSSGRKLHPPTGRIRPLLAAGTALPRPYLADEGFNGQRWQSHWQVRYGADLIADPPANTPERWTEERKHWLSSLRQMVDTVFARLTEVFSLNRLNAHSDWGQITRLAAMMAAYNCGLFLNQSLGRPPGALATLLC